jgi:NADH-quinone oxidoreductase subunit L
MTAPLLLQAAGAAPSPAGGHPLDGTLAEWAWLLPLLPLLGALVNGWLALAPRLGQDGDVAARDAAAEAAHARTDRLVAVAGPGVVALAFALAVGIFLAMRGAGPTAPPFVRRYAQWMPVDGLAIDWGLLLDPLSTLMTLVVTGVGTLIHVFAVGYMRGDPGFARFFAWLNLFVACMLTLVLGSSYPVLFVGWEGVGLCSYLLIGFWFGERANADAGRKAFIVNRIGDAGFLVAMFLMWAAVGTLDFGAAHGALAALPAGAPVVTAVALALLVGCAGKSAQLPLHLWLPDAMAGPTPVSALIHAATMVTAGVYLVARASPVFAASLPASLAVMTVGAATALFAATVALRQWDIKKVLAYSTVSQLGYMFIAVGAGAYTAGVFHLVTHAFFKALLFLAAGAVIHAVHAAFHAAHRHDDAQDLRNMGGLRPRMPVTAALMAVGTLAIAGLPPLAGFFSKDAILTAVFARAHGSPLADAALLGVPGRGLLLAAYVVGLLTALLTAAYMTRMLLLAFAGQNRTGDAERAAVHEAPPVMLLPMLALGVLAAAGGWLNLPALVPVGPVGALESWLAPVVATAERTVGGGAHLEHATEQVLVGVAVAVAIAGLGLGALLARRPVTDKVHAPAETGLSALVADAWGLDRLADRLVARPVRWVAERLLADGVERGLDRAATGAGALLVRLAGRVGATLQGGDVGRYTWVLAAGALAMLAAFTLRIALG